MNAVFFILLGVFVFVCVVMTLLILIQKGRGGGLASAFGGAGGNTAFGSKTGDVLTWATSVIFGIFLLLAIILNLVTNKINARTMGPTAATTAQPAGGSPADAARGTLPAFPENAEPGLPAKTENGAPAPNPPVPNSGEAQPETGLTLPPASQPSR